jgi:L-asparaginase/Glu-tRNA(Gln) amidotransferase subunit D
MAVLFQQTDGRPRFFCDFCKEPITDFHVAMAIYQEPPAGQEHSRTSVFHAHKKQECQANVRLMAGQPGPSGEWGPSGMWDELSSHLVMSAVGAGLFPEDFLDRYSNLLEEGVVPRPPSKEIEMPGEEAD